MCKKITDEVIEHFLKVQIENGVEDFGYLLIPDDPMLNDQALSNLKIKWNEFCKVNDYAE